MSTTIPAKTWSGLLARHLLIRRARYLEFAGIEQANLIRHLRRTGVVPATDLDALAVPGPRNAGQLMGLTMVTADLLERIAAIERGYSLARREELLGEVFSFLALVSGLPGEDIRAMFSTIDWTTPGLTEVMAGGGLTAPGRSADLLAAVQSPEKRRLLALVARRITHDLLIHGNSLRFFYQALPLMRDAVDRGHPGLTNLYIGFSASLQLLMILYGGAYPDGAALQAGRVQVETAGETFQIKVAGINFPSVFNELVKGLYEALLHPGMPTAEELGDDEAIFRELTAGPDLEYELQKLAPEASLRMHAAFSACRDRNELVIRRKLTRSGYDPIPPAGEVSMLYRSFAKLDPLATMRYAGSAFRTDANGRKLTRMDPWLLEHLEE